LEHSEHVCLLCREGEKNIRRKIGIMGGTFNPVHTGHVYMAQRAREEFSLDTVMFIPTGIPPHKSGEFIADSEHRFAMLELATEGYPYFTVSRIEMLRTGKTYTIDTLRFLHESIQDAVFYFIIGADTLFELHQWRNFGEVATLTEFICFYRPGTEHGLVAQYAEAIAEKYGKEIHLSAYEGLDVASSTIRERIEAGLPIAGMVDEKVERYISDNRVYR
jgi:nicotinate-nucleotide adenylyltransferase